MEVKAGATAQRKTDLLKTASQVQRALSGLSKEQKMFVLNFAKGAVELEGDAPMMASDFVDSEVSPSV